MSVSEKHPLYGEYAPDWKKLRDVIRGERAVKDAGTQYLPATAGMVHDGMQSATSPGFIAYAAYRTRAHFREIVSDSIRTHLGAMHHKPAVIELPTQLEPLRENATFQGESLQMLLQRVNYEQLAVGRCGLLADLPLVADITAVPQICLYPAEKIINWDDGPEDGSMLANLNLVVLDESGYERIGTAWDMVEKYRMLLLGELTENEPQGAGTYAMIRYDEDAAQEAITPMVKGTSLDYIPFTFINAVDVVVDPDKPPLNGLADINLTMYRADADYRQNLHEQAQDTLIITGGDPEGDYRVGAQGGIVLPTGGKAEYIGVRGAGLSEMRLSIENDKSDAAQIGGALMDSVSRERESGQALAIRVSARTAALNQIAIAGAHGLEQHLRQIATWIGADPMAVQVEPNLDFIDDRLEARAIGEWMAAISQGAPMSKQTLHTLMQDHGVTEMTFDEEIKQIEAEEELEMLKPMIAAPGEGGAVEDEKPEDEGDE